MALPASDDFNRANANPPSANWTNLVNAIELVANQVQGTSFNYNLGYWSADVFAADQYVQSVITQRSDGGPAVRVSSGNNAYIMTTQPGTTRIDKLVGGSTTQLQTGLAAPAVNDVCYIEVVGTTIKIKVNGVQRGTNQTDSSLSAGSGGYYFYDGNTHMDDFLADNFAVPMTPELPADYAAFPKFLLRR